MMRRVDRELGRDEAMGLLAQAKYGTLCMAADDEGYPYGVPLNCALIDNMLVFHGATEGLKYAVLGRDARASFVAVLSAEAVPITFSMKYESVCARGRVRMIENDAERLQLLTAFTAKVLDASEESIDNAAKRGLPPTRMFVMDIDSVTGKRSPKA